MDVPSQAQVNAAIRDLSLRQLDTMPVGSVVMLNEVIGYKKMSFWWNVRCWGFWVTFKRLLRRVTL